MATRPRFEPEAEFKATPLTASGRSWGNRVAPAAAVLLFLVVGVGWLSAMPPWEAPDEPWHMAYAERLAVGAAPSAGDTYESHQAPGYYVLIAAALRTLGRNEVPRPVESPYFPFAQAVYWHPPDDPGAPTARLLRALTGLLASLAVALTWAAGRRMFPGHRLEPFLAASVVALLPQFQFIGHAISNDAAATIAGSCLVYAGLRYATGRPAPGLLAIGCAGAVLTKATALAVVPAACLGVLLAIRWPWAGGGVSGREGRHGRSPERPTPRTTAEPARRGDGCRGRLTGPDALLHLLWAGVAAGGAAAAVAHWLPQTWSSMVADATHRASALDASVMSAAMARAMVEGALISAWGRFGWLTVDLPRSLTLAAAAVAAAVLAGLVPAVRRLDDAGRRGLGVVAVAVLGMTLATARNAIADPQPQGRFLFPALTAAGVLFALGFWGVVRPRRRGVAAGALLAGLLLANGVAVFATLPAAFAPWARSADTVALRVLPPDRLVTARIQGAGHGVRQTIRLPRPATVVAVPYAAVMGGGEVRLRIVGTAGRIVAETEVSLDDLPDAGWLRVRAAEPVPPGPVALEIELVRGQGQVQLWGSAGEGYPDGELFVDGEATGRDLVIVATTDPSRVRGP